MIYQCLIYKCRMMRLEQALHENKTIKAFIADIVTPIHMELVCIDVSSLSTASSLKKDYEFGATTAGTNNDLACSTLATCM